MKFFASQISYFLNRKTVRRNTRVLLRFILVLLFMMMAYSILFHYIMAYEGHSHSWLTGIYWTLTVMTTLGFGDITFHSDLGRAFSILVLMSGLVFLVVLLPFTFIQFFYAPWMEAQARARAPRSLPSRTRGHVIFTTFDEIAAALIGKLSIYGIGYVILLEDLTRALELYDSGYQVAVGHLDDPDTYRKMRIESAALLVANSRDEVNTNIAVTAREVTSKTPVVSIANSHESVDILELAGSSHVLELYRMLGEALARRALGGNDSAHEIGSFGELIIAEGPAMGTPLTGKMIVETGLRENMGVTVIGMWEQGKFVLPGPRSIIDRSSVLILAGTAENIRRYNETYRQYGTTRKHVIILGMGRVGTAVAETLEKRGVDYRIIEKSPSPGSKREKVITGDAAGYDTLSSAGIREAHSVIITTNDDAMNIYITIYCRRLRPDIQIVSRANNERNISTLHRAGADLVISLSTLAVSALFNYMKKFDIMMLAEGLDMFRLKVPPVLAGRNLIQSNIRQATGCSVVAIQRGDELLINPDPAMPLPGDAEMVLIGTLDAEKNFAKTYIAR